MTQVTVADLEREARQEAARLAQIAERERTLVDRMEAELVSVALEYLIHHGLHEVPTNVREELFRLRDRWTERVVYDRRTAAQEG